MRQLGRTLRRLREQAGLNQNEVGDRLRFSNSKMSRVEQGRLSNYHEFLALLDLYGVIVADYNEYLTIFDRANEKGWWRAYGLDDRGFVSIEADASVVRNYELGFVPGLLQTETYIRNSFATARVPLRGERLENQIAVRLRRQLRLTEEPRLTVHALIDESVLRRPICDPGQLRAIAQRAALPNVTVRVLPNDATAHGGLYSNFIVVNFPDAAEPGLAYVEYGFGSVEIEQEQEVRAARLLFDHLTDLALSERDSLALVEQLATGT
ncbi:transcriptional regulator [Amycolatopsis antarctica]|uniref:Transcriptional regulator n=2 Tax=Amycolatopsis antarctica TaxID=1854586 RepID=A0A263CY61_9PSEU|nr:transcriptional regulator [Amycolatopsis antarctica]